MDNLPSNVVQLRPAARLMSQTALEPELVTDPLRPIVDRLVTSEEAEALRAQIPEGGLLRAALEQYLEAQSYQWRHWILCSNPGLIDYLWALPRPART